MITLKDVSFTYANGEQDTGLENINLTIQKGEVVLLCGESGCGKTTMTRLINGLIPHYYEGSLTGEILICGENVREIPLYETAKLVGSVFQNPRSQFFNVDTTSELAFGGENMGLPEAEIERRMQRTVRDFRIEGLMNRSIFELSGGEKQKIACASVSVCDTPVLVLDEPSSNLDISAIEELRRLIGLWKSMGKTIVIAEHRLYFLRELADRALYMKRGRIEKEFSMKELKAFSVDTLAEMGLRPLNLENLVSKNGCSNKHGESIFLSDFTFHYKHSAQPALDIDRLELPKGGIIAVIGYNGAGKSTFARCLCGLEKRCRGVLKEGGNIQKAKQRLKCCYMVMQDVNHQLFAESVLDEVLVSMREPDEATAEKILDSLDLLAMKELHPMSLSGGQKQRVAIASALVGERDMIIFDEPTSGLDLRHMKEVSRNLRQLCEQGKSLFIITHDIELVMECCTHILHLENGKVIGNYPLDIEGSKRLKSFFDSTDRYIKENVSELPFNNRLKNTTIFKIYTPGNKVNRN